MSLPRSSYRMLLTSALALALLVSLPPVSGEAGSWNTPVGWKLGKGLRLQRWDDPATPRHIFVLRIDPDVAAGAVSVDTAMPGAALPGDAKTSEIAARAGAFAAINGDFGTSRPDHPFASDGELWQNGPQKGFSFAVSQDERSTYFGDPRPRVTVAGPTGAFVVENWNAGAPSGDEIAGYTPRGGSVEDPPEDACSVKLEPVAGSGFSWAANRNGVIRSYKVVAGPVCQHSAVSENGMTVLSVRSSASSSAKAPLTGLKLNDTVSVKWSSGWPGVTDSISGRPLIVKDGRPVSITCAPGNPLCQANPRTAVAVDAKGIIMFVVADGRAPGWSSSITLSAFEDFLVGKLGAVNALNMDGGGSSTMWVQKVGPWCFSQSKSATGCVVNHANPGANYVERSVENALVVYKGMDPNEPVLTGP
jgi:phosphodiester glycosidase